MRVLALETSLIKPNDDLVAALIRAVEGQRLKLSDGDILAISSKVVASVDGRVVKMKTVSASRSAKELGLTGVTSLNNRNSQQGCHRSRQADFGTCI